MVSVEVFYSFDKFSFRNSVSLLSFSIVAWVSLIFIASHSVFGKL